MVTLFMINEGHDSITIADLATLSYELNILVYEFLKVLSLITVLLISTGKLRLGLIFMALLQSIMIEDIRNSVIRQLWIFSWFLVLCSGLK